jgi:hypothetical protein
MTWDGHDFLDSIKNNTVWQKILKKLAGMSESVSLELLKKLALRVGMETLGLAA